MPFFQLPFPCGETWRLATYHGHDDYDIDMTFTGGGSSGRAILASAAGTVAFAGWGSGGGNYVVVDHGGGWRSTYLHMIESPMVGTGQSVAQGQQLGRVGSTGNSTGPHLHYEVSRDGGKTEAYFNGSPSGITSDGSSATGPIYVEGAVSAARNATSANCQNGTQVYEASSANGWRMLPVSGGYGPVTGTATAAIQLNGVKILYSLKNGQVFEAASNAGWANLNSGINGAQGTALAAITLDGVKYVYTVIGGYVHEASSANGWRNLNTGIGGVGSSSISVIQLGGVKYIYSIVGGYVHEAHSANGWRNLNTGVPGSAVAAIAAGNVKILYVVNGGSVYEAASNAGWANNWTGISGVSSATIAAAYSNGEKLIYTMAGGYVHEASSYNGWRNLNSGVTGSRTSVLALNGVKYLYPN
ncbi:M23 family metallopeptidase [Catellatospora sp. KI3]|uniref:M23 family metallopeptidase n=1 Tax=Catellatospora sp. KI3 TaxID=3041620 RepID=UPI0024822A83|nr:M23 family metallopeptidase [Catellatospora sp. KI3]MDI1463547.1 M23 family metallopeptidase [Catellatospora sp. KI3]